MAKKSIKRRKLKSPGGGQGQTFRDYNPATVDPNTEQFPPTEAEPIRRGHRQAGVS